jgi:translation initiation factor 2 subunit 3
MVTVTELPRLGNWYGPEPPALGEDVMCRMIEQSVVSGITVELPEYSNLQCVVPVSQLPRKKSTLHKMMKYLRKDQERGRDAFFIARVYSIDDSTGEVTLTVTCWRDRTANDRRVRDEEFAECKRRFNEAKTLLKIVKRLYAHRDNEDWQIKFMHPLYSEDNEMEPMEFIEAALVKPNLMEQLSIAPEDRPFVIDAIIATIGMNKIAKLAWRIDFRMRDKSLLELQMAMEAAARVAPPQHGRVRQVKVEYHGEMIIATAVCPHPKFAEEYLEQVKNVFLRTLSHPVSGAEKSDGGIGIGTHQSGAYNQPTMNIGMIGHVANGKSTVVKTLTGVSTQRFQKELEGNMSIHVGYCNMKIYRQEDGSLSSSTRPPAQVSDKAKREETVAHVSFIDCPGHHEYMSAMLGGSGIFDAAILVIAANEIKGDVFPRQTIEHLMVWDIVCKASRKPTLILLNKCDQITAKSDIEDKVEAVVRLVKGTCAENAPVVPCSANLGWNMDTIRQWIAKIAECHTPTLRTAREQPFLFSPVRSFDVNKVGSTASQLCGAVLGGGIAGGEIAIGDKMALFPGQVHTTASGELECRPYVTTVVAIKSGRDPLDIAGPGGSIGIETTLAPYLAQRNQLVGQIGTKVDACPPVFQEVDLEASLLAMDAFDHKIKLREGMPISLQIMTTKVVGVITGRKKEKAGKKPSRRMRLRIKLSTPVCARAGTLVALSTTEARLVGYGEILSGVKARITGDCFKTLDSHPVAKECMAGMDADEMSTGQQIIVNAEELVQTVCNLKSESDEKHMGRYKIPLPNVTDEGIRKKKFYWHNARKTVEIVKRSIWDLVRFMDHEFGSGALVTYLEDRDVLYIKEIKLPREVTRRMANEMRKKLAKYLNSRVKCSQCSSLNTVLEKKAGGRNFIVCQECLSQECVGKKEFCEKSH